MSKALLLVRVEEREQLGQGQALPRTQGSAILGPLHIMLVTGRKRWFLPPFKEPGYSQSSPKAKPQHCTFGIRCSVSEISLWLISSECVSVFSCLQQELFL